MVTQIFVGFELLVSSPISNEREDSGGVSLRDRALEQAIEENDSLTSVAAAVVVASAVAGLTRVHVSQRHQGARPDKPAPSSVFSSTPAGSSGR